MRKKHIFYEEFAYLFGIIFLALGASLMEKADLGISMVVAPAYLVYLKLSQSFSFFTFGMAEYLFQAILLIAMIGVIRKFKWSYLFSFVTAVLYGVILDAFMKLVAFLSPELSGSAESWIIRIILFLTGMIACAIGVAFIFHTYVPPEVYELFVKEVTERFHLRLDLFKTIYDCSSCVIAIIMSFAFFGLFHFEGVKIGTVICALVNGKLIGLFSRLLERFLDFKPFFKKFNTIKK